MAPTPSGPQASVCQMGVGGVTTGAHGSGGKKETWDAAGEWAGAVTVAADAEAAPRPRTAAASPARMKAREARRIRALGPVRTGGRVRALPRRVLHHRRDDPVDGGAISSI